MMVRLRLKIMIYKQEDPVCVLLFMEYIVFKFHNVETSPEMRDIGAT